MNLSASLEEYLSAIYTLSKKNEAVRVTDIATLLGVKKSSTNTALNHLKEQGLINYEKYKAITLTKTGTARADFLSKRHSIFKKFLTDIIKTDEDLAEVEAEKLSHCVSCHTTAKLEKYIRDILESNNKKI